MVATSAWIVRRTVQSRTWSEAEASLERFRNAVTKGTKAASDAAETVATVAMDTKEFVQGGEEELPTSLKQCIRLFRTEEVQALLRQLLIQCWTVGSSSRESLGYSSSDSWSGSFRSIKDLQATHSTCQKRSLVESVLDRLLSESGSSVISVILGKIAADAISTICSHTLNHSEGKDGIEGPGEACLRLLTSERGRNVLSNMVTSFTISAVSVYLQKTSHLNYFDRMADAMSTPLHKEVVRELAGTMCREGVTAFVRTSRETTGFDTPCGPCTPERTPRARRRLDDTDLTVGGDRRSKIDIPAVEGKNTARRDAAIMEETNGEMRYLNVFKTAIQEPQIRTMICEVAGTVSAEATRSFIRECWPQREDQSKVKEGLGVKGIAMAASMLTQGIIAMLLILLLCAWGFHPFFPKSNASRR